jgi:benzylsuccinate CoA-transferase BbsF subunit
MGVLDGVRVLTLEQVHALPWGTSFLADFGAEVIRVESVEHMQDRRSGPFPDGQPSEEWWNEGGALAYFGARNKSSLCLEVVHPRGKELFLKLVESSDVVTDNFRPGTMARFGFDHESLAKINPRIISLSCTAYGHTGPWRRAGSRARTVDAACGLSYLTGYEGGPSQRASSNYMDHSAGDNVAYSIMLALYNRERTGKGMRIDLSMQETGVSAVGPAVLEAQRGITRSRRGCGHIWKSPHNIYPCKGEDRWCAITVSDESEWRRLKRAMGSPDWVGDSRYDSPEGRWEDRHNLDEQLGEWTRGYGPEELMLHLQEYGVPTGAVFNAEELASNHHLRERGYLQDFFNEHAPQAGVRTYAGRPFHAPLMPLEIKHVPTLGEDNWRILRTLAGLSEEEIDGLAADGIISDRPKPDEPVP